MTSVDTSKPSTQITKVVRFRTPDGLQFITYPAAQQHWSRERLVQYLRAHDWRNVEELADILRQDWHIYRRGLPVLDDEVPAGDIYERVYDTVAASSRYPGTEMSA